jgi:hypothetical protein
VLLILCVAEFATAQQWNSEGFEKARRDHRPNS